MEEKSSISSQGLDLLLRHIRMWECRTATAIWRAQEAGSLPEEPAVGSAMAKDMQEHSYYFPAVWNALAQAVDHLSAFADAVDAGAPRPFAYPSLLRAALIGGAEAVWLLAPNEPCLRRCRAGVLSAEELKNHAAFCNEQRNTEMKLNGQEFKRRYSLEMSALGQDDYTERYSITTMLRDVGRAVATIPGSSEARGEYLVGQWRLLSAQAHGRVWDKRYRAGYAPGNYNADGRRLSLSYVSSRVLLNWLAPVMAVLTCAWQLFDDGRRDADTEPTTISQPRGDRE